MKGQIHCRFKRSIINSIQTDQTYLIIRQSYYKGSGCFCDVQCVGCACRSFKMTAHAKNMTLVDKNRPNVDQNSTESSWSKCLKETLKKRTPSKKNTTTSSWACVHNIWMVTSCDTAWPNDIIREQCSKAMNLLSNYITYKGRMYQVPVFTANGEVFRNRFCAQCNYHKRFTSYSIKFTCQSTPPNGYALSKLPEYLFRMCINPVWMPKGDQPRMSCPKLELPCSGDHTREKRRSENLQSCKYCAGIGSLTCNRPGIEESTILVSAKPKFKKTLTSLSLSVPFEFINKPARVLLISVTCPQMNHVYDPYLERCRRGVIGKPEIQPFDTYQLNVFYNSSHNISLVKLKSYFIKQFGSEGFRYFKDDYFSQGVQFLISIQRFAKQRLANEDTFKNTQSLLNRFLHLNETIKVTMNGTEVTIYKVTYRILTCADLQTYHKHEYAFLDGYMPAVYLNRSRETFPYHNYFVLKNGDIAVCKLRIDLNNCTGAFVPFNATEYTMLPNKTVRLNSVGKMIQRNEYEIKEGQVWICVSFGNTFQKTYKWHDSEGTLEILTFSCMIMSIISLVFVLVTYSLFAELRTLPGMNLMNLSVAILLSQFLWLLGSGHTDKPMACTTIAVLLHYFFLVSFVWTSIIAFDTWKAFTAKGRRLMADSKRKRLLHSLRYMAIGWLSVMVYETICVSIDQLGIYKIQYGSRTKCWIDNVRANVYVTIVPVAIIIVLNIILFAMTVNAIKETQKQTKLTKNQFGESDNRHNFGIYVRIAVMMGFTWIFGFIAPFGLEFLWYPHVILNSSQGVYIAIAFGLNKRVRKYYVKLFNDKRTSARESMNNTKLSLLGSSKREASSNSKQRSSERRS